MQPFPWCRDAGGRARAAATTSVLRDRHSLGSTSTFTAACNVKAGPGDFDRDRSWILRTRPALRPRSWPRARRGRGGKRTRWRATVSRQAPGFPGSPRGTHRSNRASRCVEVSCASCAQYRHAQFEDCVEIDCIARITDLCKCPAMPNGQINLRPRLISEALPSRAQHEKCAPQVQWGEPRGWITNPVITGKPCERRLGYGGGV